MAEFLLNALVFVVIIVLLAVTGYIVVLLGTTPGKIARRRGHPQADAINVCSWLGVVFIFSFFVLWPIALIWAYTRPPGRVPPGEGEEADSDGQFRARLEALEEKVRQLATEQGGQS